MKRPVRPVLALAILLAGCTGAPSPVTDPGPSGTDRGTATTPPVAAGSPTGPPPGEGDGPTRTVLVYVSTEANCGDVRPVERQIPDTEAVATATLNELFAGRLTDSERAAGLTGFGPATAGLLRQVRIADGIAYVDLNASHRPAIDSAGTSCGGAAFHTMIASTLRQFPTVREVRYAFDGDPRAFIEFAQGACPEGSIPPGDPCDPLPWS